MHRQRQRAGNRVSIDAPRVLVVGAGIGGLAAALELQARGARVTLLEAAAAPGGKLREVTVAGRAIDAGPTVFTMRWVFDELFAACGEALHEHLRLQPLQTLARHAWPGGDRLDLFADLDRSADAIAAFSSAAEAGRYRRFAQRAEAIYRVLEAPYLRGGRTTPWGLAWRAGWRGWAGLARVSPVQTLARELAQAFGDPRLSQLFARYATYCGSSPFIAPATLMLVAHVERAGVWAVEGGMHGIARALAALVRERGAELHFGTAVAEVVVEQGRACGVVDARGRRWAADAVVFNGDVAALAAGRLGAAARRAVAPQPAARRSLSAITWNLVAPVRGAWPLLRHNVCFSTDYRAEFDEVFVQRRAPREPTVYLCAQDRGDDDAGPTPAGAAERLLVLINAPPDGDRGRMSSEELQRCQEQTFAQLQRCGLTVAPTSAVITEPADFERMFPATGGALYGRANHGPWGSFSRPGAASRLPGLYLAGGSTHPGPGVPMAALSGRQAAARAWRDLAAARPRRASTPLSAAAATPGGTSTP